MASALGCLAHALPRRCEDDAAAAPSASHVLNHVRVLDLADAATLKEVEQWLPNARAVKAMAKSNLRDAWRHSIVSMGVVMSDDAGHPTLRAVACGRLR